MYTQCSHCKAIFRVTMKELTAAQGLLRCGECDAIFDAMRSLSTTLPEERRFAQNHAQTPAESAPEPPEYRVVKEKRLREKSFFQRCQYRLTQWFKRNSPHKIGRAEPKHSDYLTKTQPHQKTTTVANNTHKTAGSKFFLLLGIGALVLLLLLQLLYSNRNGLASHPLTANLTQQICQRLGCEIAIPRDVRQVKLLSRNVYSHPNTPNVLTISVSIQNEATFAQPFPLIEISFLNNKNEVVALRRFAPEEYLKTEKPTLMPINEPSELILNISDPGKDAVRFQFRFL